MDYRELWKLANEMTVIQAALLIIDLDPADVGLVENWAVHEQPPGYNAVVSSLKHAVMSDSIQYRKVKHPKQTGNHIMDGFFEGESENWERILVPVEEIKNWLVERNYKDGFFVEKTEKEDDFMDSTSEFYAPKLAAGVSVWRELKNNPSLLDGKTPKQAAEKYLRENASRFGLTKDDGSPNEKGIAEICKVANWSPLGGVAKTRTQVSSNPVPPLNVVKSATSKSQSKPSKQQLHN